MRIFHIQGDSFAELDAMPAAAPKAGYYWVSYARAEFEKGIADVQSALQRWTGGQLVDLHVSDLLNPQLPSTYDYTSWYDLLVFRRLTFSDSRTAAGLSLLSPLSPARPGATTTSSARPPCASR